MKNNWLLVVRVTEPIGQAAETSGDLCKQQDIAQKLSSLTSALRVTPGESNDQGE